MSDNVVKSNDFFHTCVIDTYYTTVRLRHE
jgi:hypothetical protein